MWIWKLMSFFWEINFDFIKRVLLLTVENIINHKRKVAFSIFLFVLFFLVQNTIFLSYFFLDKSISFLENKSDIILELKQWVSKFEIDPLIERLKNLKWVEIVKFTSSQQSLEEFSKSHPSLISVIKKYNIENPLPDTIEVISGWIEAKSSILNIVKEEKYLRFINQNEIQLFNEQHYKVLNLLEHLSTIFLFWAIIYIIVYIAYFIILTKVITSVIRMNLFKIRILISFWGSYLYICFPYILEFFYYSLFWFVLSLFLSVLTFPFTVSLVWNSVLDINNDIFFTKQFWIYLIVFIFILLISSCISCILSIRRFK